MGWFRIGRDAVDGRVKSIVSGIAGRHLIVSFQKPDRAMFKECRRLKTVD
jgi:hypothetical protein